MHITKEKGDLGVLKVSARLCELGYLILNPMTEHSPFDIVIYKDGKFSRVQVKYRTLTKGVLTVQFRSIWVDKVKNHIVPYNLEELDIFAIYCPDNDKCYFLKVEDFRTAKSATLRVTQSKNNQSIGVLAAYNFEQM